MKWNRKWVQEDDLNKTMLPVDGINNKQMKCILVHMDKLTKTKHLLLSLTVESNALEYKFRKFL